MNIKEIKEETNYFNLVKEGKELGISTSKLKKEKLRSALLIARKEADEAEAEAPEEVKVAEAPEAKEVKAEAEAPEAKEVKAEAEAPEAVKAAPVEISKEHAEECAKVNTKKERVIKFVTEFGYSVALAAKHPLVDCHPTNAHAILRAAGLSKSDRKVSPETKAKIRATVMAKIEAEKEANPEPVIVAEPAASVAPAAEKEAEAPASVAPEAEADISSEFSIIDGIISNSK